MSLFPKTATVALVFALTYQSVAAELYAANNQAVDAPSVHHAFQATCESIFSDVKTAGFSSIALSVADVEKWKATTDPMASAIIH